MPRPEVPHGSPEKCREFIHEMAGLASLQAGLAMQYAEMGDDAGLSYAMRRWVAYTRAAVDTLKDLKAMAEAGESR